MVLTGPEIKRRLGKDIFIEPFNESQINPNSYNLRLDNKLLVYENDVLDMKKKNPTKEIYIPETGLLLEPFKLYLGKTVERTKTYNLLPMIEGRSSVARLGLTVHVSAGFGDTGFEGYWTLEIFALQPVVIYPYVEICQIYYHTLEGEVMNYTSGKYQNNHDVLPSKLYEDFLKAKN